MANFYISAFEFHTQNKAVAAINIINFPYNLQLAKDIRLMLENNNCMHHATSLIETGILHLCHLVFVRVAPPLALI